MVHNKLFWRRLDYATQAAEAAEEVRKRYSIYSVLPPRVKDPKAEPEITPKMVSQLKEEAKSAEAVSSAAKQEFKAEPTEEKKESSGLEYPECSTKTGLNKVVCLVGSILKDKSLDRSEKVHRLQGVSLHNRRWKWAAQDEVDRRVARAREYVEATEK